MVKYWINTVHRNHVLVGKAGSFVQADHGKRRSLDRMNPGDYFVYYSPRTSFEDKTPLQSFTALARIADAPVYQAEMSSDFQPFRREAHYFECRELPIRPLIEALSFIEDKKHWGFKFRTGAFEIPASDFVLIAEGMGVSLETTEQDSENVDAD